MSWSADDEGSVHGAGSTQACSGCIGLVTIHGDGPFSPTVDYFVVGHASKFVRAGAVRIGSTAHVAGSIENVAFKNPDGSKVLIALNSASVEQSFEVRNGLARFAYSLPAGAVATLVWK